MKHSEIEISRELETRALLVYVPDMSTPIGRLKHLRHVVENVPDKLFSIDTITSSTSCGTIGCMFGHAAMDPAFNALGLSLDGASVVYKGERFGGDYYAPARDTFGISHTHVIATFSTFRKGCEPHGDAFTKAHGIARIDRLIAELGGEQ